MSEKPQTTPLTRLLAEASVIAGGEHPCHILGHRWVFRGGANCGCEGVEPNGERWKGQCSVPVYECDGCGDCDYGDNDEAREKRVACAEEMTDA